MVSIWWNVLYFWKGNQCFYLTTIHICYFFFFFVSGDKLPKFTLDGDHRVQIFESSRNLTQYLCSVGWDDFDAEVLCKSFNRTWIGNATLVDKLLDISITPISLHCGGHEENVFSCNFTEDEEGCNTTKVAGAICFKGT